MTGSLNLRPFRAWLLRSWLFDAPLLNTRLLHARSFIGALALRRPLARVLLARHRLLWLRSLLTLKHFA